ncbi:MAG: inositol 2-dehydrogenase [Acidimicrobiales bacterium]
MKIAVLGVGRIGAMHADLIENRVEGASVAGVFDVFDDAAANVAARLGVPMFTSIDEALAGDADAVAICTSTPTHVDLMIQAAGAGKAIFCEKPVSLDLDEVDRGLVAVSQAGVPLHIGFNRRFDPSHAAVQAAVAAGEVGDLRQMHISSRDPEPPPIDYVKVSGGIFLDMTIHDFDMARFVTGSEVVEVYATGSVTVDSGIGDVGDFDTVTVLLTHENGTVTTIDNCRQSAFGYDQRVEAFGSKGMVTSENHTATSTVKRTAKGSAGDVVPHFFLERYIPSYLKQWEQFIAAVESGSTTPVTGADGRAPLVIGLAAKKSAATNQPVRV